MARISSQLMSTDDLPIGWETSWEDMVGSPRFEESLETCGCLLEDVRTSVAPVQKSLEPKVVQQLVARREKRRLYELQTVLLERKRIIGVTEDTKTGDTIDWAAKMKQENEVGVAALQPSSASIGATATSTTLTLEPSRTRTRYDLWLRKRRTHARTPEPRRNPVPSPNPQPASALGPSHTHTAPCPRAGTHRAAPGGRGQGEGSGEAAHVLRAGQVACHRDARSAGTLHPARRLGLGSGFRTPSP